MWTGVSRSGKRRGCSQITGGRQAMHFELSQKTKDLQQQLTSFMEEHIYPNEQRFQDEIQRERWVPTRIVEELKPRARAAGLWNLFLPDDKHGAGLSNVEY